MILVDDRAGSRDLIAQPPLDSPDVAVLCRLGSADVAFSGNGPAGPVMVGIEVKSIYDLIGSTDTGRLQATQIPGMLADYDPGCRYLLIYGAYRAGRDGQLQIRQRGLDTRYTWHDYRLGKRTLPYSYVVGFLASAASLGLTVATVCDASAESRDRQTDTPHTKLNTAQAAAWVYSLYRWWSKDWSDHTSMRTFDRSTRMPPHLQLAGDPEPVRRLAEALARLLPAVGYERAMALARRYGGSLRRLIDAGPADWGTIDGIGPVISRSMVAALR